MRREAKVKGEVDDRTRVLNRPDAICKERAGTAMAGICRGHDHFAALNRHAAGGLAIDARADQRHASTVAAAAELEVALGPAFQRHPDLEVDLRCDVALDGTELLQLMHEVVPGASPIGVLINPTGPNLESVSQDHHAAARKMGLPIHVLHASTESEIDAAFDQVAQLRLGALVIGTDTFFNSQSKKLGTLSLHRSVPAIYQYREFVAAGGLMSYAGSITDAYRMAGIYTGRILTGEKPSGLPVQQSTKAELFINLKSANALGVTIPAALLARADELIE
jgi:ABC-type uncharacterized transport system substrate-binding protein